ncbi:putative bifunctional diguanylate cyclase/phosphodiesterase [Colwellia psychrerythraea]|jgi:diguanylate cyclase (GGDEF)-like protein|uniref:GGDEF/EAL domain protein n=1 Tax=Colwellia psychrerythraea (strain 34H / ATCC BAA-681) TaxID=167879 RepID=Q47WU6_COLP3|nr:EAL domain-containing protein [Colwellia psychrerythraea]AAZ26157.1 GGDEF/EAL domain protein [Colwellia psychrerythraea 34H]
MAIHKVSKAVARSSVSQTEDVGFFQRFAMVFESLFIVLITAALMWSTRFFDITEFVMNLSSSQPHWQLGNIITLVSISALGSLVLLIRYSLHLRKKMKLQFVAEEEIKRLAFFDSLTNLPNKELCQDRIEQALARAARNNTSIAVLFIGIDDFKAVNDQQGHVGGDKLLKQIAKRLSGQLRSGDTLARITGVEFIIILETISPKDNINMFADKILLKLTKCYRIAMQEVYITGNIGVALYPSDGEYGKELIQHADTAMCFAKEKGRNRLAFFSKELQEQVNIKKKIAEQLRGAMERDELVLHYQPIIATHSNEIIAVEALLRWNNELLGDLAPDVFIPIAEEIGIITKIGDWVLAQACLQNKTWQQQGYPCIVMTINMSVMQLAISNYARTVSTSLTETSLEPQYLELEFTENTLMKDAKQSIVQLRELSALGVSIALDDFGTGYSSIKHLAKFKLNKLKIDGSFIKHIPESAGDIIATRAIIALAKQLKLHVTAEGVETANQCEFMMTNNVDSMQGYHFSRPVAAKAFELLLQSPSWQSN